MQNLANMKNAEQAQFKMDFFINRIRQTEKTIQLLKKQRGPAKTYAEVMAIDEKIHDLRDLIKSDAAKRDDLLCDLDQIH